MATMTPARTNPDRYKWAVLSNTTLGVFMAVLVVTFGRLGDIFGRVRMYNAGFFVFTVGSALLALTPMNGAAGALWLIGFRVVQGIGGALLMANSAAILTDAFPPNERGMALGI